MKLTRSELYNILDTIDASIYWKDRDGLYLGCNKYMLNMAGISDRNDIIGKRDDELPWKESASLIRKIDNDAIKNGKFEGEEHPLTKNQGKKIFHTKKTPLFTKNGKLIGVIGISIDITEKKKTEKLLEEQHKELIKSKEKAEAANNAKSEFIKNMSHDIRTPLTGIIGLSGILEDELIDAEQKESAHMLNMSGEQLLSLLNSILDIVSSGSVHEATLNLSSFNLEEMLQNIFELQLPALQLKSIRLSLNMENAIPKMIESDKGKIYRILLNLLSNAIKFTTEGHITISVKLIEQHEATALLEFKIADSGIGIDEKDQEKVFEQFFRATPSYQGTYDGYGVGLAIVKQYLQCLDGDIKVQSCLNQGTTVTVSIPVKTLSTETIAASNIQQEATVLSSKALSAATSTETDNRSDDKRPFVLLVEDNPMAMRVASMMLNKGNCHYRAWGATEQPTDLRIFRNSSPT